MLKMEMEGLKTVWLSTTSSSRRVKQFQKDPRACIYFLDPTDYKGLMLVGEMEVLSDPDSKGRLWREGFEMYYPKGVSDPDYSVLRFTAKRGNYYHGLRNTSFDI
jgi:general stress protein 26